MSQGSLHPQEISGIAAVGPAENGRRAVPMFMTRTEISEQDKRGPHCQTDRRWFGDGFKFHNVAVSVVILLRQLEALILLVVPCPTRSISEVARPIMSILPRRSTEKVRFIRSPVCVRERFARGPLEA